MAQLERYIACVILVLAGISCVESRKDYHPHLCSGFFIGPQPQNPCGYLCYTFEGVFQGILSDGARCRPSPFFGRHGRCYRGECIVQRPKIRQCDDVYRGAHSLAYRSVSNWDNQC
ncbi:uncharacterized protein LOC119403298 [Rhipicephalus sanguineus]|uniref:uncharacterized protein LOC119403298 n=1 Tax=Rhipicephalus sanguineus TaxID=34632 RepID=UPI0020C55687|nr:uncharacterized protein LOC119403298 [Rhipicephalus sanguineus]